MIIRSRRSGFAGWDDSVKAFDISVFGKVLILFGLLGGERKKQVMFVWFVQP